MYSLRQTLLIASVVAFSLCSASIDPVTLSRKPKVGEAHEFKVSMVLHTSGIEIKVNMTSSEKILEVNKDGSFVMEETQKDQVISVAGQAQPSPPDATGKLTYSKTGEIIKIDAEQIDPGTMGMANLMALNWPTKPVDVGSKWETDTKSGTEIHHKYEILAREKLQGYDVFKISVEAKETSNGDASGTGIDWVDVKTGLVIKATGDMKNIVTGGMLMDSISFELTLVK